MWLCNLYSNPLYMVKIYHSQKMLWAYGFGHHIVCYLVDQQRLR